MTFKTILAFVCVLALVLTGCAAPATKVPTETTKPTVVATEPSMTKTSVATEPVATNTKTDETPTVSVPVTGEATVNVSESTTYGPILVNGEGFSLYLFMADTQDSGISTCGDDDGCSEEWPPLLSQGAPVAGEGVDATLLSTITRDDGSLQVTYNGWPLYLFAEEDKAPGDTNGQGLDEFGGLWFLVTPTGEAVQ